MEYTTGGSGHYDTDFAEGVRQSIDSFLNGIGITNISQMLPSNKLTPFESTLRENSFFDSDQIGAAWRTFAAQIQQSKKYTDLAALCVSLNESYLGYIKNVNEMKRQRFNLSLFIDGEGIRNVENLDAYAELLTAVLTKKCFIEFNNFTHHLQNVFGVNASILAGVALGSIHSDTPMQPRVLNDVKRNIGASSIITEVPGPTLAGGQRPYKYHPKTKGKRGHVLSHSRRSYKRRRRSRRY
jgi:hypothetical protein